MDNCLFCRIVRREIPSTKVYEDELCYAFHDIQPQAAKHILLIPKEHIPSLAGALPVHKALLGHLLLTAADIAKDCGIDETGYRVATNIGEDGRQSVGHLHFHILGGQRLGETIG